ncbi:hypothetical protein, partial [Blastococcus saxobsidens]|uniref:hypothetical protein n=1 Tax=Blastococcus saxobsidens TaxID=138336 RepID=UPI0019530BAE
HSGAQRLTEPKITRKPSHTTPADLTVSWWFRGDVVPDAAASAAQPPPLAPEDSWVGYRLLSDRTPTGGRGELA